MISCDSESEYTFDEEVVVEAYLYTGQYLDSIRIVKTFNNFSENEPSILTEELEASIQVNDELTNYIQSQTNPEYYINSGEKLLIEEGQEYSIQFLFNGLDVTSSVIGQVNTEDFTISDTIIYFDDDSFGNFFNEENNIEISWNNPNEDYYMVNIQLIDTTGLDENKIFDNAEDAPYSMLMPPMNFSSIDINTRMIQYFGDYRVVLYKVNDEFIEFYEGLNQNSSNLVDVPSNINNGKGIFTSMSSDTLYLNVSQQ